MDNLAIPTLFSNDAWQRCVIAFFEHLWDRSNSRETQRLYRMVLSGFFVDPERPADEYSRDEVSAYIHQPGRNKPNAGQPPSAAAINLKLDILKSWYSFASNYTVPGPNHKPIRLLQSAPPTLNIRRAKPEKVYRTLSGEQLSAFFAAIHANPDPVERSRDFSLFLCYFYTARRNKELCGLCWGDIERCVMRDKSGMPYEAWRYRYHAKGRGGQHLYAELPRPCYDAILSYLVASGRKETIQPGEAIWVFHRHKSNGKIPVQPLPPLALTPGAVLGLIKRYAIAAGIPPSTVCVHSLRHASAQQRYLAGASVLEVKELLGHSNLQTTYTYLQALCTQSDSGATLLESRFAHLGVK